MAKQKIAIIAGYGDSLANFRGRLMQDMIAAGYEVHAIAPEPSAQARRDMAGWGVHLHALTLARTGLNPLRDLATLWALVGILRRIRPTVVLSYTIKPVIYGSLAARLAGVRRVYAMITGLGYAFAGVGWKGRLLSNLASLLYRRGLAKASGVIFQNPDDLNEFNSRNIIGSATRTIIVNGSGVDVDHFSVQPLPKKMSFLLIARLIKAKGVFEYVEAARSIRATHPDCRFDIVGWLDENPNSIGQADLDAWTGDGTIHYWGKMEDVRPAIANAAVYVLSSYSEGTPRTVLEAMAMGRPIITTDAPGCRETVVDGYNGYLVEVGSSADLAKAMLRCLDDPAQAAAMGRASASVAREKYDVRKVNSAVLQFMDLAQAGKGAPE